MDGVMDSATALLEADHLASGLAPLVLVADDDPAITRLMGIILEGDGFRVATAGDGNAAVAMARSEGPDAILLDIMMPGMNGWAVLDTLRSDPATAGIPVIVVSACDGRADDTVRPDAIFTKPFDAFSLVGALRTVLFQA